jgi:twitching motility protein PilI
MVGDWDFLNDGSQDISVEIQEIESREGELHLRFYVPSGEEFALPATAIREVMQQPPDRITPIPNVSPLLLGTINLRGQVIWVADLGQFLGDTAVLNTERQEIPIIAVEDENKEIVLGLAVERLGEIDWRDPEKLQISTNIPDNMLPFIQGEWSIDKDRDRVLRLLNPDKILNSARWAA